MSIPKEIIDNSEGNKLVTFLNEVLKTNPNTNLDIATAFFNIQAYSMIKDNLNGIKRFRLLLGKEPEIKSERTLGDELLQIVKEEVEGFELSKESVDIVKGFIEFLKKENVEVRIYEKFLHGKAYIFDDLIIVGSSNFTSAGLTRPGELNSVSPKSYAEYARREWFEKFWQESRDFKNELIALLEASRFGTKEYTPYEVFIKAIYELQKEDVKVVEEKAVGLPPSKVELTEFQEDAIPRIMSRLKKYGSILIADSVGLGKTWIAKKIIELYGFYRRKNYLVICPAQLRERLWRKELKDVILAENILSQEELASSNFLEKAKRVVGGKLDEIELIVVDESHNLRNPLSNRWENFFTLYEYISKNNKPPKILFLTATPINNTIWDLYWQIMLLIGMNKSAFAKENIPDLFKWFKEVDKRGDPSLLNDLLNEISIRRTRDYIKKNYPNATIKGKKIVFPKRILENINYKLNDAYRGMYKEISDTITEKLTMACYQILKYKKTEKLSPNENWALQRMIALSGILKTIFLKRLESSVEAFRISLRNHINFLVELKKQLNEGKYLTKQAFNKYLMSFDEEIEEFKETLERINLADYKKEELFKDIDKDIQILTKILNKVEKISPKDDAKLNTIKKYLLKLAKREQTIVFTYYADTLEYIFENLKKSKEFSKFKIEKISGATPQNERLRILDNLLNKKIDILISTDVLSEGENLQSAQIVLNYDLHWNPTRMIQRAGRIDRIGSPYKEIFVYNVFPEDELEELLRLVQILQNKIIEIDESVGLDQQILGEEIHPKVFGIIRRIKKKDEKIFDELEAATFGGGEKFYQPLKDFLNRKGVEELEKIPLGIHSGLENKKIKGIFFYYKYLNDFHFWYLYDVTTGKIIKNKTEIIDFISCPPDEKRVIPNFFNKIYEVNEKIIEDIEGSYKELEQEQRVDTELPKISKERGSKFIQDLIREVNIQLDSYLSEFPEEKSIEELWDKTRAKLLTIPLTKRRLQKLRKIWWMYKKSTNWKKLIEDVNIYLKDTWPKRKIEITPFDRNALKLVVIDFIS
jgi:superfamily II DNA or RNA helicase